MNRDTETVPTRHATPDLAELRDQIAGTIHRRICEHSREDCIENLGKCERATDSAMPLISTALDEGHAMARLLADALKDAIRTLRELAEKAAGEPIPFGDFDLYAEVVDGALDAAAERDALAAKVERVRALHRAVGIYDECDCDAPDPATHFDVDDVGLTCNLMYRVCAECCRDNMYQTEGCASYHAHRLDEDYHCPTIRALDEENAQSRAPQHPNTYRQPEGNRA